MGFIWLALFFLFVLVLILASLLALALGVCPRNRVTLYLDHIG